MGDKICKNCDLRRTDLTGMRFGRLVVMSLSPERSPYRYKKWICKCDCGNTKSIIGSLLVHGKTRSCGCILGRNYDTKSRLYSIWIHMKSRCNNPKHDAYKNYGGRGIKICSEWVNDFMAFKDWALNNGYADSLTLDRIDNNKGYAPDNCRWATNEEQASNKRNNHYITVDGITKTVSQWEKELGLSYGTIYHRLKSGWSERDAVTTRKVK